MSLDLKQDILNAIVEAEHIERVKKTGIDDVYLDKDETVYGKWLPVYHNGRLTGGECSICGKYKRTYNVFKLYKSYKFCHGCGTKMKK